MRNRLFGLLSVFFMFAVMISTANATNNGVKFVLRDETWGNNLCVLYAGQSCDVTLLYNHGYNFDVREANGNDVQELHLSVATPAAIFVYTGYSMTGHWGKGTPYTNPCVLTQSISGWKIDCVASAEIISYGELWGIATEWGHYHFTAGTASLKISNVTTAITFGYTTP